jgi:hypothetical protein
MQHGHVRDQLVVGEVVARRELGELLADDVVAQVDALVADVDARTGDELGHLLLALAAERAVDEVLGARVVGRGHAASPPRVLGGGVRRHLTAPLASG